MSDPTRRTRAWVFEQPYLLLFLTALFWGGNAVAGKFAVGEVSPLFMTFARWVIATSIATALAWPHLTKEWQAIRRHIVLLFFMGALGFAAFNLLFYTALHHTTAINVSVQQAGIPMVIVLVNLLIYREPVGLSLAAGVALSILGVLVTATHGDLLALVDLTVNRGDAMMLLAVLLYAGYSVSLRNRPKLHWLSFMAILSAAALITSSPFAAWEYAVGDFVAPSSSGWAVIVYIGLFPSLFAQLFFARGVDLIGANRAGIFVNLVPVLGSLLAILLLGEQPAAYHAVGYGLILSGILIAQRRR